MTFYLLFIRLQKAFFIAHFFTIKLFIRKYKDIYRYQLKKFLIKNKIKIEKTYIFFKSRKI